jgi:hypothetical protein
VGNYPQDVFPHDNLNDYHNGTPCDSENQEFFLSFPNARRDESKERGDDGGNGNKYDRDDGCVVQSFASRFGASHTHPPDPSLI